MLEILLILRALPLMLRIIDENSEKEKGLFDKFAILYLCILHKMKRFGTAFPGNEHRPPEGGLLQYGG